jgi:hypothetical protein
MTARELIRLKPEAVQIVLKARMAKTGLHDPAPDWDQIARQALDDWNRLMEPGTTCMEEIAAAEAVIAWMRKHPVWGKILREGAN